MRADDAESRGGGGSGGGGGDFENQIVAAQGDAVETRGFKLKPSLFSVKDAIRHRKSSIGRDVENKGCDWLKQAVTLLSSDWLMGCVSVR